MPIPLHQYASVPVSAPAAEVHRRLRTGARELVATATAEALTAMGRQAQPWGFRLSEVPVTTARATESRELGSIAVRWTGREDATGWPALTGRLVVVADAARASRLLFVSPRSPQAELATIRLDRLHRLRMTQVGIQRFLLDLAGMLSRSGSLPELVGSGVSHFDRTPLFVHHLEPLDGQPGVLRDLLMADLTGLAERATAVAVQRARDLLEAGRFRARAGPTVQTRPARPGEPVCAWIGWRSDEEATGWPEVDLALLVEAHDAGSRLVVLSPREPGYDLSVNRMDKRQRHQILARAGADLAVAIRDALVERSPVRAAAPAPRPLVSTPA